MYTVDLRIDCSTQPDAMETRELHASSRPRPHRTPFITTSEFIAR